MPGQDFEDKDTSRSPARRPSLPEACRPASPTRWGWRIPSREEVIRQDSGRPVVSSVILHGPLGPEPTDERDEEGDRAPEDGPGIEDRGNQHDSRGDGRQEGPDGIARRRLPSLGLSLVDRGNQQLAAIHTQSCSDRQDLRVLPKWCGAGHDRDMSEVVAGWGRGGRPFEGRASPWVVSCRYATADTAYSVDKEAENAEAQDEFHAAPVLHLLLRADPARHARESQYMHRKEVQIEPNEHESHYPA